METQLQTQAYALVIFLEVQRACVKYVTSDLVSYCDFQWFYRFLGSRKPWVSWLQPRMSQKQMKNRSRKTKTTKKKKNNGKKSEKNNKCSKRRHQKLTLHINTHFPNNFYLIFFLGKKNVCVLGACLCAV